MIPGGLDPLSDDVHDRWRIVTTDATSRHRSRHGPGSGAASGAAADTFTDRVVVATAVSPSRTCWPGRCERGLDEGHPHARLLLAHRRHTDDERRAFHFSQCETLGMNRGMAGQRLTTPARTSLDAQARDGPADHELLDLLGAFEDVVAHLHRFCEYRSVLPRPADQVFRETPVHGVSLSPVSSRDR